MHRIKHRAQSLVQEHRRGGWLVGCGIALLVVGIIIAALVTFVAMNWRGWAADGMDAVMTQAIEQAPIDEAEKSEVLVVVRDVVQRFRDGNLSLEQMSTIAEKVAESPILPAGAAMGIGVAYFGDPELTDDEKADGMIQLQRIAHGLADKSIQIDVLREVLAPLRANPTDTEVIQFDANGEQIRIKAPEITTTEELRAFIAAARQTADDNNLPTEPPQFDLSTELDKAIKTALGEIPDAEEGATPNPPPNPPADTSAETPQDEAP